MIYSKIILLLVSLIVAATISGCTNTADGNEQDSSRLPSIEPEIQASVTSVPGEKPKAAFTCLQGIIPGVTSRKEVTQLMGEPLSTEFAEDGNEYLYYSSSVEEIPHTIVIKQDIVEVASALNSDALVDFASIQEDFGEPEQITFSYFMQGTYTFLYPKNGFALIAEPEGGQVFWTECFVAKSLEDYLAGLGSSLPLENPYIR